MSQRKKNEYEFYVNLCGGSTGGTIKVKANCYDDAYDAAMDMVGDALLKAFPTLEIEYDVESVFDYEDED